jgi:putative ABC transport system permease protein
VAAHSKTKSRMFWRVLWRLMRSSRGPLALALLAVASGAAVSAALLNVDLDAGDKLTREFRTLGANVVVSPQQNGDAAATMDGAVAAHINSLNIPEVMAAAPYLYLAAQVGSAPQGIPIIVAGSWMDQVARISPSWQVQGQWITGRDDAAHCMVGSDAARLLNLHPGSTLNLSYAGRASSLVVAGVITAGSAEDSQVLVNLNVAQDLAGLSGRIGMVQLSVNGSAPVIERVMRQLAATLPAQDVRPVRQLAAAEGRLFERIHGLLFVTVALILILTALGVLAAMAGLALQRRRDVGLMKALGGTVQRVMRFFLVEATALGLVGGIVGCAAGMLLAQWIGQRVFASSIAPRLIVVPATLAMMVGVALVGALPLRLLGRVRPAEILRNE